MTTNTHHFEASIVLQAYYFFCELSKNKNKQISSSNEQKRKKKNRCVTIHFILFFFLPKMFISNFSFIVALVTQETHRMAIIFAFHMFKSYIMHSIELCVSEHNQEEK